jgi:hypothetical protein
VWKLKVEYHAEILNSFVAVKNIKESVGLHVTLKGVRVLKPHPSRV